MILHSMMAMPLGGRGPLTQLYTAWGKLLYDNFSTLARVPAWVVALYLCWRTGYVRHR